MKKVVIKVFVVFTFAISILMVRPFHIAYADQIAQTNVTGVVSDVVNFMITDDPLDSTHTDFARAKYIIKHDIYLDKEYFGYITGNIQFSWSEYRISGNTVSRQTVTNDTYSLNLYVCGQVVTYYQEVSIIINKGYFDQKVLSSSFTLAGSNVVEKGLLTSIEEIQSFVSSIDTNITQYLYDSSNGSVIENLVDSYDMLTDIDWLLDGISNNVETISRLRRYDVPVYSWNVVYSCLNNLELIEFEGNEGRIITNFDYPIFKLPAGKQFNLSNIYTAKSGDVIELIYGVTANPSFQQVITLTRGNYSSSGLTQILRYNNGPLLGEFVVSKYRITAQYANSNTIIKINNTKGQDLYFMPILCLRTYSDGKPIIDFPLDFATLFKLHNSLLDNIDYLANGDQELDQDHIYYMDQQETLLDDTLDDVFDLEDDASNNLNTALQNINTNFDIGNNFGSKFLASATWVRTQFDNLTNNTPFGTVLSFSLLLGLALLIIGKAIK